jgi:hypothetical protein
MAGSEFQRGFSLIESLPRKDVGASNTVRAARYGPTVGLLSYSAGTL